MTMGLVIADGGTAMMREGKIQEETRFGPFSPNCFN